MKNETKQPPPRWATAVLARPKLQRRPICRWHIGQRKGPFPKIEDFWRRAPEGTQPLARLPSLRHSRCGLRGGQPSTGRLPVRRSPSQGSSPFGEAETKNPKERNALSDFLARPKLQRRPICRWHIGQRKGPFPKIEDFWRRTKQPSAIADGCFGTPEGTRTPNIQNRNLTLYPIELRTRIKSCQYNIAEVFQKVKGKISTGNG